MAFFLGFLVVVCLIGYFAAIVFEIIVAIAIFAIKFWWVWLILFVLVAVKEDRKGGKNENKE